MPSIAPPMSFSDLRLQLMTLPSFDIAASAQVRERDRQLTKPPGSLGLLEEVAAWVAGWQQRGSPRLDMRWP